LQTSRGSRILTETQVRLFAAAWFARLNSHDLEAIMSHYTPEIVLTSPVAARLLNDDGGTRGEFMELDATSRVVKVIANHIR
jgi:hypothetical protein